MKITRCVKRNGVFVSEVFNLRFTIMDLRFDNTLDRPIKLKLVDIRGADDWDKSNMVLQTFRTNIDGVLSVSGHFELPEGTKVEQNQRLCLFYKVKQSKRADSY